MKKLGKFFQNRLFDVAPAPALMASLGVGFLIALVITGLIILAIVLTVRAVKKNRAKNATQRRDQAQ
jgi:uncharacterized integral membrane protein